MTNTITRVNPLAHGDAIKALFLANERPEFSAWFDRAYPVVVRLGTTSWISVDGDGRQKVLAHLAALPLRLDHAGREVEGWLFSNLMADKEHRSFFPTVALARRAVADLKADGAAFIATNPINAGAMAVMRAAGLAQVGAHDRFVYLLGDRRWLADTAMVAHLGGRRAMNRRVQAESVSASVAAEWTLRHDTRLAAVAPRRLDDLYAMRMRNFGAPSDLGFIVRDGRGAEVAAALVHGDSEGHADLITLRCADAAALAGAAVAIARAMRALRFRRLHASAVAGSPFARALTRGGFLRRHDPCPIFGLGFTDAGRAVVQALGTSDLERVDLD